MRKKGRLLISAPTTILNQNVELWEMNGCWCFLASVGAHLKRNKWSAMWKVKACRLNLCVTCSNPFFFSLRLTLPCTMTSFWCCIDCAASGPVRVRQLGLHKA